MGQTTNSYLSNSECIVTNSLLYTISSQRHQAALEYAFRIIFSSEIAPYVSRVILFGSCAREEQEWDSDVDLLLELKEDILNYRELRLPLRRLQGNIGPSDLSSPDVDLKIVFGSNWIYSKDIFFYNIRKDGKIIWE